MSVPRKHLIDTIADLTSAAANPKANLKDGQQITVAGYYAAGDKEPATYVWNAASTATANGGTVIAHNDGGAGRFLLKKEIVSVKDFGAVGDGDGAGGGTNDRAAFASAGALPAISVPDGIYRVDTSFNLISKTLQGLGEPTIDLAASQQITLASTNTKIIDNIKFTGPARRALYLAQANNSNLKITNCEFDGQKMVLWGSATGAAPAASNYCIVENCQFYGDYTVTDSGADEACIDARAWETLHLNKCHFDVSNIMRFLKISGSSRKVFITNNVFLCATAAVAKQCIDLYADTRQVVCENNVFVVVGFSAAIELKARATGSGDVSEPREVRYHNNTIVITSSPSMSALYAGSSYGLASPTLTFSEAISSQNMIELSGASSGTKVGAVRLQGFYSARSLSDIVKVNLETFTNAIRLSNNQETIIDKARVRNGTILLSDNASTPEGAGLTSTTAKAVIRDCLVTNAPQTSGITISGLVALKSLIIEGNRCETYGATDNIGAIYCVFLSTVTSEQTAINNNSGTFRTAGENFSGTISLGRLTKLGNSWGPAPSATNGDVSATLVSTSAKRQVWDTTLTADRAVTLSTTERFAGDAHRIVRTAAATGAFNLNVGTGPLAALVAGQWCDVEYDGSAWTLTARGALT